MTTPNDIPPGVAPDDPATAPPPNGDGHSNPAAKAFHALKQDAAEFKEYAAYYVAAQTDAVKQKVKNIALYAALGLLGAIVGGAVLVTAAVLLVIGIGDALAVLFGGRLWLGEIVAGVVILSLIGLFTWCMVKKITHNWKAQLVKKYDDRKAGQRARFGHDVAERAEEARDRS